MALLEYITIYALGAAGYGGIELLWRGRTHWSMLLTGGMCFLMLYVINRHSRDRFWKKCVMGASVITTLEFLAGAVVNIILGWDIWDYSHMPLNLMGQICALFSMYWLLLCVPGLGLCKLLDRRLFRRLR